MKDYRCLLAAPCSSLPLTVSGNLVAYRGDVMTAMALATQYHGESRAESIGGRVQLAEKGKASLNVKVRLNSVGMIVVDLFCEMQQQDWN